MQSKLNSTIQASIIAHAALSSPQFKAPKRTPWKWRLGRANSAWRPPLGAMALLEHVQPCSRNFRPGEARSGATPPPARPSPAAAPRQARPRPAFPGLARQAAAAQRALRALAPRDSRPHARSCLRALGPACKLITRVQERRRGAEPSCAAARNHAARGRPSARRRNSLSAQHQMWTRKPDFEAHRPWGGLCSTSASDAPPSAPCADGLSVALAAQITAAQCCQHPTKVQSSPPASCVDSARWASMQCLL